MAAVLEITDPSDPRLADYMALTDGALRNRLEPERGCFIAEGELVIRRATRAGYRLRSLLLDPKLARLAELADGNVPVYVGAPAVLEAVTGFHVHRGALASVARRALPDPAALVEAASRLVVLEGINNATNLGAVVRCAAALGMDGLLLDPTSADPLFRRSVRVSMGEVFALPWTRLANWPGGLDLLRATGFTVLALTPDETAEPLDEVDVGGLDRVAVLLGAEGPGLSAAAQGGADRRVRIPMSGGVDSLNVAAAAAVAFWVAGRRRR